MMMKKTWVVLVCILILQLGLYAKPFNNDHSERVSIFGKVYQKAQSWAIKLNCSVYTFAPVKGMELGGYYLVKGKKVRANSHDEGQHIIVKSFTSTISLKCLGTVHNPYHLYLYGKTVDGAVGLVPETGGIYSGTHWETEALSDGSLALRCLCITTNPDYIYLDGRTRDGSVGLAPETGGIYSGTHWQVEALCDGSLAIRCLGQIDNPHFLYLYGRTRDGSVGLAPETGGIYSGTHWQIDEVID